MPLLVQGKGEGNSEKDDRLGPQSCQGALQNPGTIRSYNQKRHWSWSQHALNSIQLCWGHEQGGQEGNKTNSSGLGGPEFVLVSYPTISPEEGQSAV